MNRASIIQTSLPAIRWEQRGEHADYDLRDAVPGASAGRAVAADRGYGQDAVERDLHAAGVRTVAIPRQATNSPTRKAVEHGRGFRRLVKSRTGCEGRISYLKRGYGWDRTRLDGRQGAAIWCRHGVLTHNLVKIATLAS